MAREPYRSNMLALLQDTMAPDLLKEFTVEIAGSSCSDVIALDILKRLYLKTHGFKPTAKIIYPSHFVSQRIEPYPTSTPVWAVHQRLMSGGTNPVQTFEYTTEGKKAADTLCGQLLTAAHSKPFVTVQP